LKNTQFQTKQNKIQNGVHQVEISLI